MAAAHSRLIAAHSLHIAAYFANRREHARFIADSARLEMSHALREALFRVSITKNLLALKHKTSFSYT